MEQDLSIFLNKNYQEYSHYDFISLIKKVYRKEIMEEREKLKNYASEFKKYINTLNLQNSLYSNVSLNIPELQTEETKRSAKAAKSQTKSAFLSQTEQGGETEGAELSENVSCLSTQTYQDNKSQNAAEQKEDSTLIQQKETFGGSAQNSVTKKEYSKSTLKKKPKNPPLRLIQTASGIIKDQKEFLRNTQDLQQNTAFSQSTTNKNTFYDKRSILYEDYKMQPKKKRYGFTAVFLCLLLGGFSIAVYSILKGYNLIEVLELSKPKQAAHIKNVSPSTKKASTNYSVRPSSSYSSQTRKRNPSSYSNPKQNTGQTIKVFINSKPSGAAIFINGRFSSKYTPSSIALSSNDHRITLKKTGYLSKTFPFHFNKNNMNIILEVNQNRARNF